MADMLKTITVLLQLEAIDKAGGMIEGVVDYFAKLKASMLDAGASSQIAGDELAAAQIKAEASENAFAEAQRVQTEAQQALAESMTVLKAAQEEENATIVEMEAAYRGLQTATSEAKAEAEAYYKGLQAESAEAAKAVQAAVDVQLQALGTLNKAEDDAAVKQKAAADAQAKASTETDASSNSLLNLSKIGMVSAAAVAGIGYESIKAAASFQQATTVLVTSGGETEQNIELVRNGILNLTATTGTSTQQLINGMYMIGSAGYTGAKGIAVLTAAAQGAKAENADLMTVSNALTTVMKDYYGTQINAAQAQQYANTTMNALIFATSNGKTTTEAMAGSLSKVLPMAHNAGLGFDQVAAAMATMTGEGTSADMAAQDLNHTIDKLNSPTAAMTKTMALYGITAQDVSEKLGQRGLNGTLQMLTEAITAKMGPAGVTILNTFNQSKIAAQDADAEFKKMPADLQKLANEVINGTISYKDYNTAIKDLTPDQRSLMQQWENLHLQADGFNNLLRSGSNDAQTFQQALKGMTGDQVTLTTALQLTGNNMDTFNTNVANASKVMGTATSTVSGWNDIQGNLNQQLSEMKGSVEVLAIKIGNDLIPVVTSVVKWFNNHKTVAEVLATAIGITLVTATAAWITTMIASGIPMMINAIKWLLGMKTGAEAVAVAEGEAATGMRAFMLASEAAVGPIGILVAATAGLSGQISGLAGPEANKATISMANLTARLRDAADGSQKAKDTLAQMGQIIASMSVNAGKPTQDLKDLDQALADLVKSGKADLAKKDIDYLTSSLGSLDISTKSITGNLPTYNQALNDASAKQQATGDAAQKAAAQVNQLDTATQKMDGTIQSSTALTQMKSDMLSLKDAVAQNGTALGDNTKEGLANETQFNQLANEISQYRQQQIQATGDTNAANKTFNDQYNQLVTTAQGFGFSKDEVVAYLNKIGLIPQSVSTSIGVNIDQTSLNMTLQKIGQIIDETSAGSGRGSSSGVKYFAHGGLVSGPGSSTSDSVPAMLSNGEYVMGADTVSKLGVGFFDSLAKGGLSSGVNIGSGTRVGGGGGGGVAMNMTFNFPGSVFAGPQAQSWLMNTLNQVFVQKILPQAGVPLVRASA